MPVIMPGPRSQASAQLTTMLLGVALALAACVTRQPASKAEHAPKIASAANSSEEPSSPDRAQPPSSADKTPQSGKSRASETQVAPQESLPPLPDTYLAFAGACDHLPGDSDSDSDSISDTKKSEKNETTKKKKGVSETVMIAAVGDVLLHHELQIQAFAADDRHRNIWRAIEDLLRRADITYANLEGPMATGIDRHGDDVGDPGEVFDRVVYTAYPRFNFHASLAIDLKRSGVDLVSTANNHALDRQAIGIDKTIDALRAAGLRFTGTRASDDADPKWHTVLRRKGLRIAFLACTGLLNVRPDSGGQVLRCRGKAFERRIAALAKSRTIDALIVTPHWGKEYETAPREREIELAKRWAEAGATAIIGSHPHVLQPWQIYPTSDGREVLIHYSLGNFASHQPEL
ncbi:MAG TPA: hypothetical protein ENK31_00170, partial [Nannocystis exedens]|nr:hypothetical protein [Nannocystis exedens]